MRQHTLALRGRLAQAVGGLEQAHAQNLLDAPEPAAGRGLVDAQPRAGAGESALVADRGNRNRSRDGIVEEG
jgi:hypothetical protein